MLAGLCFFGLGCNGPSWEGLVFDELGCDVLSYAISIKGAKGLVILIPSNSFQNNYPP